MMLNHIYLYTWLGLLIQSGAKSCCGKNLMAVIKQTKGSQMKDALEINFFLIIYKSLNGKKNDLPNLFNNRKEINDLRK